MRLQPTPLDGPEDNLFQSERDDPAPLDGTAFCAQASEHDEIDRRTASAVPAVDPLAENVFMQHRDEEPVLDRSEYSDAAENDAFEADRSVRGFDDAFDTVPIRRRLTLGACGVVALAVGAIVLTRGDAGHPTLGPHKPTRATQIVRLARETPSPVATHAPSTAHQPELMAPRGRGLTLPRHPRARIQPSRTPPRPSTGSGRVGPISPPIAIEPTAPVRPASPVALAPAAAPAELEAPASPRAAPVRPRRVVPHSPPGGGEFNFER